MVEMAVTLPEGLALEVEAVLVRLGLMEIPAG
jgi:hypothetical protein